MFASILAEKLRGSRLNFVENVVKGNSEQIALNFPAKSLIYIFEKTLVDTFLIIENHLTN